MSQVTKLQCDGCGKIKGESNSWYALWVSERDYIYSNFYIDLKDVVKKDYCGSECLIKAIAGLVVAKKELNP